MVAVKLLIETPEIKKGAVFTRPTGGDKFILMQDYLEYNKINSNSSYQYPRFLVESNPEMFEEVLVLAIDKKLAPKLEALGIKVPKIDKEKDKLKKMGWMSSLAQDGYNTL